ncbi:unnamed protein product [Bursaphelenchus xylophilus]|uniref:(pine wood nematode) hypothetical protein n=1 Tax=Bursaphelenchus xylophilus TaxID=6326 RepID=A0A1I7RKS6_BURXY|nr:unnamed protein product [Bursaphelenchus xylophilus]CAG9131116.1 unnamed protein product [Bursaphelenchus xylophilus]
MVVPNAESPSKAVNPTTKKIDQIVNGRAKTLQKFVISRTERPFIVPKRANFVKSFYQPQISLKSSNLYGSFKVNGFKGNFTVAGMKIQHRIGQYVDYIVHKEVGSHSTTSRSAEHRNLVFRHLKMDKNQAKPGVEQPLTRCPEEYTMRLCNSDSVYDHMRMLREISLLKMISKQVDNKRLQGHFLKVFERGALKKLLYYTTRRTTETSDKNCILALTPRPNPRPFIISEPPGLTFEELIKLSKTNSIEMNSSRHLIVGVLHTLRVLHHLGYVHRCVTSQTFGLCKRNKSRYLSDRVQCQSLWYVRRYAKTKPRKRGPFVGSYTFCSLEAMNGMEHLPNDDLTSSMYTFVYLTLGYLPWMRPKTTNDIWSEKQAFHDAPKSFPASTNVEYNIERLSEAFNLINSHNPYKKDYSIYSKLIEILGKMVEENESNIKKDENFVLPTIGDIDLDDLLK